MNTVAHERYVNLILPNHPRDFSFSDTVIKLKALFGRKESIFSTRYKCLKLVMSETEDFVSFACRVNKAGENFELAKLTIAQFKFLLFVSGLLSASFADVPTKLLTQLSSDKGHELTLDSILNECVRLGSIKTDTELIGAPKPTSKSVCAVNTLPAKQNKAFNKKPRTPCWLCGAMHYRLHIPQTQMHTV